MLALSAAVAARYSGRCSPTFAVAFAIRFPFARFPRADSSAAQRNPPAHSVCSRNRSCLKTLTGESDAFPTASCSCGSGRQSAAGVCWFDFQTKIVRTCMLFKRDLSAIRRFLRPHQPNSPQRLVEPSSFRLQGVSYRAVLVLFCNFPAQQGRGWSICYTCKASFGSVVARLGFRLLVHGRRGRKDPRKPAFTQASTARSRSKSHRPANIIRGKGRDGREGEVRA